MPICSNGFTTVSEKGPARAAAVLAAIAVLAAAIVAYEAGRRGRPPAPAERSEGDPAPAGRGRAPVATEAPAPLPETPAPAGTADSAVFEQPVAPQKRVEPAPAAAPQEAPAAQPEPYAPPQGERRDAARCIRLDVTPTYVEAHRVAGPVVQLTVRAHNGCAFTFEGRQIAFRISATSPDGFELAHTTARLDNDLPPYGTAQTTVDLLCDATRVARYRVELL
jgi:hypothetical protein